jgi:DNA polymerase III epsilon subunit-like protein
MKYLKSFNKLNENKIWYKSIPEILNWIKSKSDKYLTIVDTETTGLPSDGYEIQLTQISAIVTKYDFKSNKFTEIDSYNKKIELTETTLQLMKDPSTSIKKILLFNHYEQDGAEYHDEQEILKDFFDWIKKYNNSMLVIQNASFDMGYLNTRNPTIKFDNEVLDTKMIIQLYYLPLIQKLAETDIKYQDMISKIGTSDRDGGLISSSMSKIGPALGINMSGYHDALTDCRITIEMTQKIIEFLKQHQNEDIMKYQAERIKIYRQK